MILCTDSMYDVRPLKKTKIFESCITSHLIHRKRLCVCQIFHFGKLWKQYSCLCTGVVCLSRLHKENIVDYCMACVLSRSSYCFKTCGQVLSEEYISIIPLKSINNTAAVLWGFCARKRQFQMVWHMCMAGTCKGEFAHVHIIIACLQGTRLLCTNSYQGTNSGNKIWRKRVSQVNDIHHRYTCTKYG